LNIRFLLLGFNYALVGHFLAKVKALFQSRRVSNNEVSHIFQKWHLSNSRAIRTKAWARLLVAFIGCSMLLVPIIVLFFIKDLLWRILALVFFVIIFGGLISLSKASPTETMIGVATFAAVLVVFVGSTNSF
jgi:hypothetical protein